MELSSDNHVPKDAQIADIFRQRIACGVWTQGFRLPANEDLAAEFGVSRVTIRQAVELLARDGMIEAQQGRGTFVTGTVREDAGHAQHLRSEFARVLGAVEEMVSRGRTTKRPKT